MSLINDIPSRENGQTITAAFFNTIKTQLLTALGDTLSDDILWAAVTTTKGCIPAPKMTEAQRDAIATPSEGLQVWNTTTSELNLYDGASWITVAGVSDVVTLTGAQTISGAKTFSSAVDITNTTQATDDDTGALIVDGGVGIKKDVYITGNLTVSGTTTTVNSSTLDVTDANITINNGGNQASADDIAGLTVEMSDATDAKIIYDKDVASRFKCGDAASEAEIATVSATQTLTNKTLTSPTVNSPSIVTPSRLDVKQDTEANLTTYAGSASNGQLCFATDTKKMYQVVDSALAEVGAGGVGSVSLYGLVDDSVDASDWTVTGSAGVAANTSTPLAGDSDFKITYTATGEKARTPAQTLQPRSNEANTTHSIKGVFKATGTSGAEYLLRALDQSNAQVGEDLVLTFNGGSNPSIGDVIPFELMFNVTSSETSIKLEIECNSFTAGDLAYITDIAFDDDALNQKTMVSRHALQFTDLGSSMTSTGVGVLRWGTLIEDGSGLIDYTDADGKFTALKDCTITISTGLERTTGTMIAIILKNGLTPTNTNRVGIASSTTSGANPTASIKLSAGDYVAVYASIALNTSATQALSVTAEADADHVVRAGEDRLSEWTSYTPTGDWASNTTYSGEWRRVGDSIQVRVEQYFSGQPSSGDTNFALPNSLVVDEAKMNGSADFFNVGTWYMNDTGTASYGGTVYYRKSSNKFAAYLDAGGGIISNTVPVTIASGDSISMFVEVPIQDWTAGMPELYALPEGDVNTFSARIANNGTASITSKNADFIESVSRTAAGTVLVTWKSGFFTQTPTVVGTHVWDVVGDDGEFTIASPTTTSVTVYTGEAGVGLSDSDFNITVIRQGSDVRAQQVFLGNVSPTRVARITHEEATNVDGGSATSGSWETRKLTNTYGSLSVTLSSNQITVPAGEYILDVGAEFFDTDRTMLAWYDVDNTTYDLYGRTAYMSAGVAGKAVISGYRFKIDVATTYELRSRINATQLTNGHGVSSNFSVNNTYTEIVLTKLA